MWPFRRKPKNRRLERQHVLDVKVRARAARLAKFKLAFGALFLSLFALALLFVAWRGGDWLLDELVYKNEIFAIHSIQIETDGMIPPSLIQRWSGVRPGNNLFALDLARVRRDLELVPYVQSAAIERTLPDRLRISVVEREPIAQVNLYRPGTGNAPPDQETCYLDPDGYVMAPMEWMRPAPGAPPFGPFPLITGFPGTELRPGSAVESPQIHAALKLISQFEHSPMLGVVDLVSIDVSIPQVLVVSTRQGSEITFALDDFDFQFHRWRIVQDLADHSNRAIASLDLSVTNNAPARWLESNSGPVAAPKPTPHPRYKRKHV